MERFKKILNKFLFPHIAILVLLSVLSVAALILAFGFMPENEALNYMSYVLSAYTLTAICFRIPRMIKKAKQVKESNKYVSLYSSDPRVRINLSLVGTFVFNSAYALFQLGLGIAGGSLWFYSLSAYYFLLAFMRLALLSHTVKHLPGKMMFREQLIYRMCGIGILLMTSALTVIIIYVTQNNRAASDSMIIPIAMAAFTFTSLTVAIVNVVRYRKYDSPVWSASKALSFVSAIVSMLTLEDTMLASFGQEDGEEFRHTMTTLTGIGIAATVISIAIVMIIHSTKKIKAYKNQYGVNDGQQ